MDREGYLFDMFSGLRVSHSEAYHRLNTAQNGSSWLYTIYRLLVAFLVTRESAVRSWTARRLATLAVRLAAKCYPPHMLKLSLILKHRVLWAGKAELSSSALFSWEAVA